VTGFEKAAAIAARKHSGPTVSMLTAYDYPTARLFDEAGIDALLVGDSLGMVDLSIGTYPDPVTALANARKLVAAGAEAVKLEGGLRQADKVRAIFNAGIPVCGHLGMLPQRVLEEGGYKKKGKTPEQSAALLEGALALVDAGVFAIVLESVIPATAAWLTAQLPVPTIGIGCGDHTCDGEVAVATDLLGSYPWFVPPFARPEANLAPQVTAAAAAYKARVQNLTSLPRA
jgi:3-methyl-2-oxobutanoate hydroxymethyltransferase